MPDPTPDSESNDIDAVPSQASPESDSNPATADPTDASTDEGPGCFPGILAATIVMGMLFFITCGFLAWVIYGKRTELAIRTLETSYIELIEQSRLNPEDKTELLEELANLTRDLKAEKYENWQAAGVMTRLARLPIIRWGDLQAVEDYAVAQGGELQEQATLHLSRMRRGVELDKITTYDMEDVLRPVTQVNEEEMTRGLVDSLAVADVKDVIHRAKLLADQYDVPNQLFPGARITVIVRRQIEAGLSKGTY